MKREMDEYIKAANNWDTDRAAQREMSNKRAWWVAGAATLIALTEAFAIAGLTPLKTVEPFVIRVDNTTGVVDVLQGYDGSAGMDEQVTRGQLQNYVETCETYSPATAERDYYKCGHFNSSRRNTEWLALWDTQNPASPVNVHKDGSAVVAKCCKSILFFKGGNGKTETAAIRFTKTTSRGSGSSEVITDWIANVGFTYAKPSANPRERNDNPLGFRITEYRADNEVLEGRK